MYSYNSLSEQEWEKMTPAQRKANHTLAQYKLKKLTSVLEEVVENCKKGRISDSYYKRKLVEAYEIINPPKKSDIL